MGAGNRGGKVICVAQLGRLRGIRRGKNGPERSFNLRLVVVLPPA